jgi:hypothetical protein
MLRTDRVSLLVQWRRQKLAGRILVQDHVLVVRNVVLITVPTLHAILPLVPFLVLRVRQLCGTTRLSEIEIHGRHHRRLTDVQVLDTASHRVHEKAVGFGDRPDTPGDPTFARDTATEGQAIALQ